jgi:hypothetical protein
MTAASFGRTGEPSLALDDCSLPPGLNSSVSLLSSNPTWCWVEDTPSPSSGVPSSSLVFTLLLQQGASLTASLAHATHILLALPPGPVADPAGLSALHWSILLGSKPNDARFVLSAEWVRVCARTGIRLREALYEIKLLPAAAPTPPTPSVAAGHLQTLRTPARERQRSGLDGQRVTPQGVSRLKVYFSAPDRLGRPTATSSTLTPSKDYLIPAFVRALPRNQWSRSSI